MSETPTSQSVSRGILKSPLDFGGGLFLIGLAIVGFFGGFSFAGWEARPHAPPS